MADSGKAASFLRRDSRSSWTAPMGTPSTTMAAWATVGVPLAHYTVSQQSAGVPVTQATLEPGDLVLTPGSDSPGPGLAGHVGVYLGFGLVLSAIDQRMGVAVQTYQTFVSGGLDALRDPDPTDS